MPLELVDAWWRAANYLSVGQIYLMRNPLLGRPLEPDDIKPRLLGHWGTSPGLNLVYAHLNRAIVERGTPTLYVCGPGHGGPAMVANTWLDGTYSELFPAITADRDGMERLFRQFSFPGGIPSHAAPETPGSINEGGELGYSLMHAYGAALDQPGARRGLRDRRRRGRDGPARRELARARVPQPRDRRRGAADPAPERLQDREPHPARAHPRGRAGRLPARQRLRAAARHRRVRRRGPPFRARAHGRRDRRRLRPHRLDPSGCRGRRVRGASAALARDRAAHAEGLDRPRRGRRRAGRGHVPRPPGSARGGAREPRAPGDARGVDAVVPARGALRRRGTTGRRARRVAPRRRAAHERDARRERRHRDRDRAAAHGAVRRRGRSRRPRHDGGGDAGLRRAGSPSSCAATPTTCGCSAPTRCSRIGSTPCST